MQKRKEIKSLKKKKKKHRKTGSTASLFGNPHERKKFNKQISNVQLKEIQRAEQELREYEKLIKKQERRMSMQSNMSDDGSVIYYDDESEMSDISVFSNNVRSRPVTPMNKSPKMSRQNTDDKKEKNNDDKKDQEIIPAAGDGKLLKENNNEKENNDNKKNENNNVTNTVKSENDDESSDENSEVSYTTSEEDAGLPKVLDDDEKD